MTGAILPAACGNAATSGSEPETAREPSSQKPSTPLFKPRIVNSYPHDHLAFTQGLAFHKGKLYESTGLHGRSSIRLVDLETGKVLQIKHLPEKYFGEGIALCDDRIIQLTWQSKLGFVYDRKTFRQLGEFSYPTDGWGIMYDGRKLVMSDGSATLYFLDPESFKETGRIEVRDRGEPVSRLNELEFVHGKIYANVWETDTIAQIDPVTGNVTGWIDLGELKAYMDLSRPIDVLNGIAYDTENDRLFVTGKLWPALFEIKLLPAE